MIINIIIISVITELKIYNKIRDVCQLRPMGWVELDLLVCILGWVGSEI